MPPRLLCVLIVVLWIASTSWLVMRDILPRIRAEEPPAFAVNIVDEAPKRFPMQTRWSVYQKDDRIGRLLTWVEYDSRDDIYRIKGDLEFDPKQPAAPPLENIRPFSLGSDRPPSGRPPSDRPLSERPASERPATDR